MRPIINAVSTCIASTFPGPRAAALARAAAGLLPDGASPRRGLRVGALVGAAAVLLAPLLSSPRPAPAHGATGEEEGNPLSIPSVVACEPPKIDGVLDDACWQEATHVEDFRREKEEGPALEPTEAWLCCDEKAIYAAFRCHDSKSSEIRCDQRKRQGHIWRDDHAGIGLDVNNTGRNWYAFVVTPAGTQWESVPGGTSEKIEWKGDWDAAAAIDQGGWTAELAIPFSILRYPQGQATFRCHLFRRLAREDDSATWPPRYARIRDTEHCARWTGLTTPPVPFRCVFMPYALSVASEDEEDREALTAGLNVKGTFPKGAVGLFTYNPDFRNLEDVVETIDFTFVERYLPEYRPFFREGQWYLPPDTLFYSRRVEDLDYGLKTFGALGHHRFGALDAYNSGGENHLALNYEYLLGTNGGLQVSAVDRRYPGEPDNLAYGIEGYWGSDFEGGGRYAQASWARSSTEGPGGDDDTVRFNTGLWQMQGLGWGIGYSSVGPEFRADDGYVPETDVWNADGGLDYRRSYDEGAVQAREWHAHYSVGESADGDRWNLWCEHLWEWRNGRFLGLGFTRGLRDDLDVESNFIWAGWNRKDMYRSGDIELNCGKRLGETYRYQSIRQGFRPTERWSAELRFERVYAAEEDDDGNIIPPEWSEQLVLTGTYDISEERSASARLVHQDGSTNFYGAYRQRVRRGMDLLVVLGDPNADEWVSRLAVKAVWCFN